MYIFVGLLYSDNRRKHIINQVKTPMQGAANTYQWGLLKGLRENTQERVHIINSVPMGHFPRSSKVLKEKSCRETEDGICIDNIGYLNLPAIKQRQRTRGLYKRLCRIAKGEKEPITVVLYSLYNPYLKALDRFKRRHPNVQYLVVVPDLPCEYGIESANKLKRWIGRRIGYRSLRLGGKADGYILLTEQMNAVVNPNARPYQIIEGLAKEQEGLSSVSDARKPVILYTGTLDRVFGMDTLMRAFLRLDEGSAELWIAGDGDMRAEIEKLSMQNENVKYFGYCSKEEVFDLQNQARILVNPRSGKGTYTQYSFPSKTLEYLSMGKPVAMNRLPGIPKEYGEHLFFFPEETAEGMAQTFRDIIQLSSEELNQRRSKQLAFITKQKSAVVQARKILQLKEDFFKD